MKKVILIDDEPLARMVVAEFLQKHQELEIVEECNNGFEGIKAIGRHKPDLVFLDVQMPKINGFEMLELLPECPQVIFTTAFEEFALKAFEANALDYLLKPFSQERLDQALEKWRHHLPGDSQKLENFLAEIPRQPEDKSRIVIKDRNEIKIIEIEGVVCIEAYDDYVKIHTENGFYLKKKTMGFYESVLDPRQFFRTHRSFFIQLRFLTKIENYQKNGYMAILKNGKRIPLSRSQYPKLKEILGI